MQDEYERALNVFDAIDALLLLESAAKDHAQPKIY
jgi:hypothetical protein